LNGSLFLRAGVREDRTVLLESRGTYPLQVLRPHAAPAQRGLSLVILLLSGGLLDGDRVTLEVVVEPGARLALRTQAATQVHYGHSEQRLFARVAEDGWFSYVPHAVVPHAGADYHGQTRVALANGARALVADSLTPGRVQFGECFAYRQVQLDLDVRRDSALVARERALIRPNQDLHCATWGKYSHVAGAYLLGPAEAPYLTPGGGMQFGATELADGGWFVRALADRATDIDDLLLGLSAQWWRFRGDLCSLSKLAHGSLVPADVSALE
jgi:urease accessory protein